MRQPISRPEVNRLIAYFQERLSELQEGQLKKTDGPVTLKKPQAYSALRALSRLSTDRELRDWADEWITPDAWRRALSHLRSTKYKSRNNLVRATMHAKTKGLLDERAAEHGLSCWAYLELLNLDAKVLEELEARAAMDISAR